MRVLLSGLPGPMAEAVARELIAHEMELMPLALTGAEFDGQHHVVNGIDIELIGPQRRDAFDWSGAIAVDFTTPQSALSNAQWFAKRDIPFIMGTTGGDLDLIHQAVRESAICAIIAPNMAAPLVLLQAAFEHLAAKFPGALAGHEIRIAESHQATKRDTSGTAKAMASSFEALGLPGDIEKVRDPTRSMNDMGVPEEHLGGHAFHTYQINSPNGDVQINLQHNVVGREVYTRGTVTALEFLQRQMEAGERGEVYSMIDVLSRCGGR